MAIDRRQIVGMGVAAALVPGGLVAQTDTQTLAQAQRDLMFGDRSQFLAALDVIEAYGRPDIAPGLILALRFSLASKRPIVRVLEAVTGAAAGPNWFEWMLWQEDNADLVPHQSFTALKRDLFLRIDPNFADFLRPEYLRRERMKIRLEEITWGGVIKDGIPSLDNPDLTDAAQATYLRPDDLVFGVAINGDARAYPLRIMGWHEMFNEVIGGVPVALAYCTLCGSGILFETRPEGRAAPLIFGSSGFLYRSNKLMFDRGTNSLWNQFTGKPVVGPLADSGIELRQRPVVITTWRNWVAGNPDTRALSLDTGHRRNYGSGVVYGDYFASNDLMFPVLVDQSTYRQKAYVFGIRVMGAAKAWPLKYFASTPVINDQIAGLPVVLIGNAKTRTVRAYERGEHEFALDGEVLRAGGGGVWVLGEDSLSRGGVSLPRVAGHIAYWFAWNNYLGAESEIYGP